MIEQILNTLGFTDPVSIFWNLLAYVGMVMIIVAVASQKLRNQFFFWGPLLLLIYAGFFIHNFILAGLQLVVVASAVLNLLNIKRKNSFIIIVLTLILYAVLLIFGQISEFLPLIGSFGLLSIAFGLTQLPKKRGFALMALGGLLIVVYAFFLQIWVFFVLNLLFFIANILELRKKY